jgi:hypothetical protein
MKTMIKLVCVLALLALANGCASSSKVAEKKPDSILEQPAVAGSGPEIHGYVSVGYGVRIK